MKTLKPTLENENFLLDIRGDVFYIKNYASDYYVKLKSERVVYFEKYLTGIFFIEKNNGYKINFITNYGRELSVEFSNLKGVKVKILEDGMFIKCLKFHKDLDKYSIITNSGKLLTCDYKQIMLGLYEFYKQQDMTTEDNSICL